MDIILDFKNYTDSQPIFQRTASRAIIKKDEKYLLIRGNMGDYKFPGGGVESGESLEETLIREVLEETGYRVIEESIQYYGKVHEKKTGLKGDLFIMDSYYFTCEVEPIPGEPTLSGSEKRYEYKVVWTSFEDAARENRKLLSNPRCIWVRREAEVMEYVMKETNG